MTPPTVHWPFCILCPKVHYTDGLLAINTRMMQSESNLTVRLGDAPSAYIKILVLFRAHAALGPLQDPQISKSIIFKSNL